MTPPAGPGKPARPVPEKEKEKEKEKENAMWVMVAGPYTAGAVDEAGRRENLAALNRAALQVLAKGHLPVIGVNLALPMIAAAGPESFDRIMMPVSLALAERCDACLRIGGPSTGAAAEAELFQAAGKPVYRSIDELPEP